MRMRVMEWRRKAQMCSNSALRCKDLEPLFLCLGWHVVRLCFIVFNSPVLALVLSFGSTLRAMCLRGGVMSGDISFFRYMLEGGRTFWKFALLEQSGRFKKVVEPYGTL
jgi:hypothetical protein